MLLFRFSVQLQLLVKSRLTKTNAYFRPVDYMLNLDSRLQIAQVGEEEALLSSQGCRSSLFGSLSCSNGTWGTFLNQEGFSRTASTSSADNFELFLADLIRYSKETVLK